MTNFNGNFVVNTDSVYVGDGFPIFAVDALADKPRSYGSAVKLDKNSDKEYAKGYPFGLKMGDAGTEPDGIIYKGVCYGEDGKTVTGKTELVMTKGLIVVKVDTNLQNAAFGDKVYWDGTNSNFTSTNTSNKLVGTVASNVFKAKTLEDSELVDAVYLDIDIVR